MQPKTPFIYVAPAWKIERRAKEIETTDPCIEFKWDDYLDEAREEVLQYLRETAERVGITGYDINQYVINARLDMEVTCLFRCVTEAVIFKTAA